MNRGNSRPGQNLFVGGSVTGSVIGDGNSNIRISLNAETDSASLDDLRELIASLREEVEDASGGKPADSRIEYELQTIEEELGEDEPDGETVRSRWKQVLKLLGPLQHVASVAQITASILALFGGN